MIRSSSFQPAWWLRNSHLQTIWASLWRKQVVPARRRERLVLPDGDFVDLDWCGEGNEPLVMLFHGLTGSSNSAYIVGLQSTFLRQGWRSVALNFRGCSGEPNHRARSYHSGDTGDIHYLYQMLREREPRTPLAAAGFSLGGNAMLKWLGEQRDAIDLFAAVATSVPYDLAHCANSIDRGFSKVYLKRFLRDLRTGIAEKEHVLQELGHSEEIEKLKALHDLRLARNFWDFDHWATAPLHGYESAQDYYTRCSSKAFLRHITVPTLLLHATDDPFMTPAVLPSLSELSDATTLELSAHGGHVGFITGSPRQPKYWLDDRITAFMQEQHDVR